MGMQAYLSTIHAAAKTHAPDVPDTICQFLAAALDSSVEVLKEMPWMEVMELFSKIQSVNDPSWRVPMLKVGKTKDKKKEKVPWLYIWGEWYHYYHIFASKYGWSESYIAELEIETAFALMQEIKAEEQLAKEWEYLLSDRSVEFDPKTKTSHLRPYARPVWMQEEIKKPGKVKVPRSMMPVGVITGDPRMLEKVEIIEDVKNTNTS
jgi:hypothetical protein